MFSKFGRGLAASAALAMLALSASARADSVTYYTEGFFGSDVPVLQSGGPNNGLYQDTITSGVSSIVFDGVNTTVSFLNGFSNAAFGNFSIASNNSAASDPFSTAFTLALFQTAPAGASSPGTLVGSVSGNLTGSILANSTGSTVKVTFAAPATFSVPPAPGTKFVYTVNQLTNLQAGSQNRVTELDGTVTELPLPNTASAGLVMLAGLGAFSGVKKLRERNAAAAAV